MPKHSTMWRAIRMVLIQAVVIAVLTLALLEGIVAFSFRNPGMALLPPALLRYLHVQFDRNTIQVMPECAVYDPGVTYTLKPGECTFSNREFSNRYAVNNLGLRDDEASLQKPGIIVLGDSLAMGWGVEQHEAFPSVVEQATGVRTLNAGISSFGTVRALRFLERFDMSNLTDLVIQYSDNDYLENAQFVENPAAFKVLTKAEYERTVTTHRESLSYFPGKYAANVLIQLQGVLRNNGTGTGPVGADLQALTFLKVLEQAPVNLAGPRVTVLSLDSAFIRAARQLSSASSVPWLRAVNWLDLGGIGTIEGAFYVLDDHPTPAGHLAIASELVRALGAPR